VSRERAEIERAERRYRQLREKRKEERKDNRRNNRERRLKFNPTNQICMFEGGIMLGFLFSLKQSNLQS
jgi:hypothetical protein